VRTSTLLATLQLGILFSFAACIGASAQTFSTLAEFDGSNGGSPALVSLIQGTDGNFYGTTSSAGASSACPGGCGTVFKITPDGVLTTMANFDGANGQDPRAGLLQATNGSFYGTTYGDTTGTVFKMSPAGKVTTLASNFYSEGALIQASDGTLYGASSNGGTTGDGSVFKISPAGTVSAIYSFKSGDGAPYGPYGGLVQATDGNFYGVTYWGGSGSCAEGCGAICKLTPAGKLTVLHDFCSSSGCSDGAYPTGTLLQASDGNLYGTTSGGGAAAFGTLFRITTGGKLTTLYSFCSQPNCADGTTPYSGVLQATDGNLYGTTSGGGLGGTIFQATLSGALTTLQSFGGEPQGGLLQSTNGMFYGTTSQGGYGEGTVYSFDMGFGPFIATNPRSGKVGADVIILGNNLTGTSSVSFNGAAAKFTVVSSSEIRATVPTGATTGAVKVTTSNATLESNAKFRVTQ
jgi:uncharacterized repeat protein (TIGR03803 family)